MRGFVLGGLFLACSVATGCVDQRYFAPRENLNGTGPGGEPAAIYPFGSDDGDVAGELRVWSRGATAEYADDPTTESGERARVEVHVGFELENTGRVPLDLGGIHAEPEPLALVRLDGESRVAPGSTGKVEAWFLVPDADSTRDVPEFSVRHDVLVDGVAAATQITPFTSWRPRYVRSGAGPFLMGTAWGPWGGWGRFGGWGWGGGAGWGLGGACW
ncbi:MAG: hypothetical protein NXI31_16115 [bacterium]|nr:hypothetical protein [bacterium]